MNFNELTTPFNNYSENPSDHKVQIQENNLIDTNPYSQLMHGHTNQRQLRIARKILEKNEQRINRTLNPTNYKNSFLRIQRPNSIRIKKFDIPIPFNNENLLNNFLQEEQQKSFSECFQENCSNTFHENYHQKNAKQNVNINERSCKCHLLKEVIRMLQNEENERALSFSNQIEKEIINEYIPLSSNRRSNQIDFNNRMSF